jgi:hypothetical protein
MPLHQRGAGSPIGQGSRSSRRFAQHSGSGVARRSGWEGPLTLIAAQQSGACHPGDAQIEGYESSEAPAILRVTQVTDRPIDVPGEVGWLEREDLAGRARSQRFVASDHGQRCTM